MLLKSEWYIINLLFDGYEGNMTGYCTLVLYFHSPVARENMAAHSCNIQPYYLLTYQIIYIYIHVYISAICMLFCKCKLTPKNCARRSVQAKYRKQLRKGSTLELFHFSYTDWPSEGPKSAQEQEDRRWRRKRQSPTCYRDSRPKERKVQKLRVRDRAKCATLNC